MLENALFLGEKWKNRCSVGGSAPNSIGLRRLGDAQVVTTVSFSSDFKIMIYYLRLE